jgi:undecaprenyl phosphate N,N'-diacetylbacillosamine 1-phosphate transferase
MNIYARCFKRVFDTVVSALLLIILAPVMLLLVIVVLLDTPGPVVFTQKRLGEGGRVFMLRKFRTMTHVPRAVSGEIFDGSHPDVTRSGSWMRRFKMDELPQLWNVLMGEMSLVGPRPCMPEQIDSFNDDGRARLSVRPGLTGLAQVNGNVFLPWTERWKFDRQYVEALTLCMDMRILAKTVKVILRGERMTRGS